MIAFFLVPLLIMTGISFVSRGPYGGIEWILTWENYVRLADPLYWHIFIRSVGLAVATTLICVVLGFPLAYLMARSSPRVQYLLICLVLIPFWTNFLVRTYAWMFLLRADGLVNTTLRTLGLSDHPVELLYTPWAVLIGLVYGYLPFMVLPLYAAIERIAPSLEEAARDLYATGWAVFTQVVLPLAKPGLVAGCVLVFVPSLGAFITPHLLGGGQTMMIGTLIQHEFLVVRDWPFGAALSLVFMATVLLILLLWLKRQEAMWRTL
ncbi:MAG: ABC transporter permease [Nitrospirae bacterium]|nr:MAG: ABC transporter permease [Nitrospirota bacterium]